MAKRQSDSQLTKDQFESGDRGHQGGPDSTADPVKLAGADVMKRRAIKQPRSRFSGANSPRPAVPEGVHTPPPSTPSATATNTNGATPFGKLNPTASPFAGFAASTNGNSTTTAPTPAQKSPNKPFSSLASNSTTPTGKPPAGLFGSGSIGPGATPPKTGGLFGSMAPVTTQPPADNKRMSNPFSEIGSPAPPIFGTKPSTTSNSSMAGDNKPKQFTGSLFGSSNSTTNAASNSSSGNLFGSLTGTANATSTSGSSSLFGSPAKMSTTAPSTNMFMADNSTKSTESTARAESPKPAISLNTPSTPSFGSAGISYPSLPPIPPSAPASNTPSIFSSNSSASTSPATSNSSPIQLDIKIPPPPSNLKQSQTEEYERLYKLRSLNESFKNTLTQADIFGDFREACSLYARVAGEILTGPSSKRKDGDDVMGATDSAKRAKTAAGPSAPAPSSAVNIFGSIIDKAVGTPTEPPKKEVKPVTEDDSAKDVWTQKPLYGFKPPSGNPPPTAKSTEPSELPKVFKPFVPPGANSTPPADPPANSSSGGGIFGNAKPAAPEATGNNLFGLPKSAALAAPAATNNLFGITKPVTQAATGAKVGSNLFGNATAAAPSTTAPSSSGTGLFSQAKPTSNIFGSAGSGSVFGSGASAGTVGGGLFANLKPTIGLEKDKGEEDEDDHQDSKPIAKPSGIFGAPKAADSKPEPFKFSAPTTTSTSSTSTTGGLFGNKPAGGDYTWAPNSPIRFGDKSETSSTGSPKPFAFAPSTTSNAFKPTNNVGFSFGSNNGTSSSSASSSLAPPPLSRNVSFDGVGVSPNTSGVSTPAPDSDVDSNNPSDDAPTKGSDWSGKGPGEENEDVLFTAPCAVYNNPTGTMAKVGKGAFRLLINPKTNKKRALVRTEAGGVIMNVAVTKLAEYKQGKTKSANTVSLPDFAATKGMARLYVVKFRKDEEAKALAEKLQEVKGQ